MISKLLFTNVILIIAPQFSSYELPPTRSFPLPEEDCSVKVSIQCSPLNGTFPTYIAISSYGEVSCRLLSVHIPETTFILDQKVAESKVIIQSYSTNRYLRVDKDKMRLRSDSPLINTDSTFGLMMNGDGTVSFLCPTSQYLTVENQLYGILSCTGKSIGDKQKFEVV
jgi:hypothetical protein